MIFQTTFAECAADGACPYGYRKAARAFGGIRKYGRDTKTDLRDLIRVLDQPEAMWVMESYIVFNGLGPQTVRDAWEKILPGVVNSVINVPAGNKVLQEELDQRLKIWGLIETWGCGGLTSILYLTNWEATQKALIAALNKLAEDA